VLFIWIGITKVQQLLANRKVAALPEVAPRRRKAHTTGDLVIPVHVPPGGTAPPGTIAVDADEPLVVQRWRAADKRRERAAARVHKASKGQDEGLKKKAERALSIAEDGYAKTSRAVTDAGHDFEDL
jgi:hypothetical protein